MKVNMSNFSCQITKNQTQSQELESPKENVLIINLHKINTAAHKFLIKGLYGTAHPEVFENAIRITV